MLLVESDALKKRCTPALIIWLLPKEQRNALQAGGEGAHAECIGSQCMQWVWYDYTRDGTRTYHANAERAQFQPGKADPVDGAKTPSRPRGYCGLAGAQP